MKKIAFLFLALLLPMVAGAETVEIDGIYYELVSKAKQAEVKKKPSGNYTGSVDIPASVTYEGEEYSVTSIGSQAFYGCSGLTSVTIPNSVTSIGFSVFYGCSGLTSVTIPNGVTSIDIYTFAFCGLTSITIPNSVTSIGEKAFQYCSGLTSVTIGNSVMSIGERAFEYCSGLTSVTIPDGVISLNCTFNGCSNLTSVTIPNSVTNLDGTFSNCTGLTSVTIPNSVTTIGDYTFYGCSGLTSVTIPNSVTNIKRFSFSDCSGLTSVTIGNSVTSIGESAFYGCSGLKSVTIPNSLTSIGKSTFANCSALASVTIGSGVKSIYSQAFAFCKELADVYCLAEAVPGTNTEAFKESYIEYATLHVPTVSINAYWEKEPWKSFKSIVGLDGTIVEPKKCATPTIAYIDGKLVFDSETEGAEFVYEIKNTDTKKGYTKEVTLAPQVTTITVYATKADYDNSDVATATIGWRNGTPILEGFSSIKLEGVETNGDVNGDGTVDVADIATIISIMAGKTTQE